MRPGHWPDPARRSPPEQEGTRARPAEGTTRGGRPGRVRRRVGGIRLPGQQAAVRHPASGPPGGEHGRLPRSRWPSTSACATAAFLGPSADRSGADQRDQVAELPRRPRRWQLPSKKRERDLRDVHRGDPAPWQLRRREQRRARRAAGQVGQPARPAGTSGQRPRGQRMILWKRRQRSLRYQRVLRSTLIRSG